MVGSKPEGKSDCLRATRARFCLPLFLLLALCWGCGRPPEAGLEVIADFDTIGWTHDVIPAADGIYVSDRQGGVALLDRSLHRPPARIPIPAQDVISLALGRGCLLLASRFEGLLRVSPSGATLGRYSNGDIANMVVVRDDLAFVAWGQHGLVVARLEVGGITKVSELPTPGWSHDVRLWKEKALLADWRYGTRIVDIRNVENPVEIAVLPACATAIALDIAQPEQEPLIAIAEGHGGVVLASLDTAGRPHLLARHTLGLNPSDESHPRSGGWAHDVAWCGGYLFVANWKRGLSVLDARDVRHPRFVADVPTSGTALGVAAEPAPGGAITVFLANGEDGLKALRFRPRKR